MNAAATDPENAETAGKAEAAATEPHETAEKAEAPAETENADEPLEIVCHD